MTTKVATMVPQQGQAAASSLKVKVALALAKTEEKNYTSQQNWLMMMSL